MSDIRFEVNGESYPLVPPGEMTMGEAREAKRITGGMGLLPLEAGMQDCDPDAWTAVLLISMRRVDPAARDDVLDSVNPAELIKAMSEAVQAAKAAVEADAAPPTPDALGEFVLGNGAMIPERAGT